MTYRTEAAVEISEDVHQSLPSYAEAGQVLVPLI